MKISNVIGIDYSTTSPAITIKVTNQTFVDYDIYYLTSKKKSIHIIDHEQFIFRGSLLPELSGIERYVYISSWAMEIIDTYETDKIILEDYAYAATGRVFNIGENTGILKYRLRNKANIISVAPTEVKKFATGKGNAGKSDMLDAFIKQTNVDPRDILEYYGENPISDIVDSYFMCNYEEGVNGEANR